MKHLPNELLYLLKVYNYITKDIGLERARSNAEKIREYIKNADFLAPFPTVLEYLSEDKSIEDIITYIQRNERTYSLLGEWKDRELTSVLESAGIDGFIGFVGCLELKKRDNDAYFTLPDGPCTEKLLIMENADLPTDISTAPLLCLEVFDDSCNIYKVSFSSLRSEKIFYSAAPLSYGCKKSFDAVTRMCTFLCEKAKNSASKLNDSETELLPFIRLYALEGTPEWSAAIFSTICIFNEYGIEKGEKLIKALSSADDKKIKGLTKKLSRLLRSKKCASLNEAILNSLIISQETIPTGA